LAMGAADYRKKFAEIYQNELQIFAKHGFQR
jgi:hypothetical protein